MSSDYHYQTVTGKDATTGYPVSADGHLLNPDDHRGGQARELTSPYGALTFAVGSGDDFWCFDYALIEYGNCGPKHDPHVILHATINSESGSFIEDAPDGYLVIPDNHAVREAQGMVDRALEWTFDNGIRHTRKGWNQDPNYFVRAVAMAVLSRDNILRPKYSDRQIRFGGQRINALCRAIIDRTPR